MPSGRRHFGSQGAVPIQPPALPLAHLAERPCAAARVRGVVAQHAEVVGQFFRAFPAVSTTLVQPGLATPVSAHMYLVPPAVP